MASPFRLAIAVTFSTAVLLLFLTSYNVVSPSTLFKSTSPNGFISRLGKSQTVGFRPRDENKRIQRMRAWPLDGTEKAEFDRNLPKDTVLNAEQEVTRNIRWLKWTWDTKGAVEEAGRFCEAEIERVHRSGELTSQGMTSYKYPAIRVLSLIFPMDRRGQSHADWMTLVVESMEKACTTRDPQVLRLCSSGMRYILGYRSAVWVNRAQKVGWEILRGIEGVFGEDDELTINLRRSLSLSILYGEVTSGSCFEMNVGGDTPSELLYDDQKAVIAKYLEMSRGVEDLSISDEEFLMGSYAFMEIRARNSDEDGLAKDIMETYRQLVPADSKSLKLMPRVANEFVYLLREVAAGRPHTIPQGVGISRDRMMRYIRLNHDEPFGFFSDLVEFCLENDMLEEAHAMSVDFLTSIGHLVDTHSLVLEDFHNLGNMTKYRVQLLMARHHAINEFYIWKDPRVYARQISSVGLERARVDDAYPKPPVRVDVGPEGIQISFSEECVATWMGESGMSSAERLRRQVEESEIYHLIQTFHKRQDWSIMKALIDQWHSSDCQAVHYADITVLGHSGGQEYAGAYGDCNCSYIYEEPHTIFIFEDEIVRANRDTDQNVVEPLSRLYRFLKAGKRGQETWVVIAYIDPECPDPSFTLEEEINWDEIHDDARRKELIAWQDIRFLEERLGGRHAHGPVHDARYGESATVGVSRVTFPSLQNFTATISETATSLPDSIQIHSPYITYEDFSKTRAYAMGVSYKKYIEWIRKSMFRATEREYRIVEKEQAIIRSIADHYDVLLGRSEYQYVIDARGRLVERRTTQKTAKNRTIWRLPESAKTETIEGFFNNIPSGPAAVMQTQAKHNPQAAGFISSSWLDFAEFTLHAVSHTVAEKLILENGDSIPILGFVFGTFTSSDGRLQARGLRLIVVDATIITQKDSEVFFVLPQFFLGENSRRVSNYEQALTARSLNPTLYSTVLPALDESRATAFFSDLPILRPKYIARQRETPWTRQRSYWTLEDPYYNPAMQRDRREERFIHWSHDEVWDEFIYRETWDRQTEEFMGIADHSRSKSEFDLRLREEDRQAINYETERRRVWDSSRLELEQTVLDLVD